MLAKEYENKDLSYKIIGMKDKYLSGLKKINIFIGTNNSGKSRFLRKIFKSGTGDFVFWNDSNEELEEIFNLLEPKYKDLYYMKGLKLLIESRGGNYIERFNTFFNQIKDKQNRSHSTNNIWDMDVAMAIKSEMRRLNIYEEKAINLEANIKKRHLYIPILRGMRHLDFQNDLNNKSDFYRERTIQDYGLADKTEDIFSGLSTYSEIKKMLLGSRDDRKFIREFEDFLSNAFFETKNITLIPDHSTDNIKINIDDKEDRKICDVGDGIQSIIINTFQAFRHQNEEILLCIEEPEMMMHPSVQRVLIETFTTKFNKLQVFLTTHSNHFLDLTYDYPDEIGIFSFELIEDGKFEIKNVTENSIILDLLGIRNSSVFLSNCVIWTEGVTDRMLLRKLLEIENIDYKEDYHYSFGEYGGSNLENFDFISKDPSYQVKVKSLTKKNYIVADNDNDNDKKSPRYIRRKNIEIILGEDKFFDKHIEIENLISYKIWHGVIERLLNDKPGKKFKLKTIEIIDEEKFNSKLKNTKIGVLLKEYFVEKTEEIECNYFKSDGIECLGESKKIIMNYVIKQIDESKLTLKDFPEITRDLIRSIEKFIANSNKKINTSGLLE